MLDGKRILIVEDEAILALDLSYAMEEMGARVVGPCFQLERALATIDLENVDAAVLDIDLAGQPVFPLADALHRNAVPFVFHSGRIDAEQIGARYRGTPVCRKPTTPETVAAALSRILDGNGVQEVA